MVTEIFYLINGYHIPCSNYTCILSVCGELLSFALRLQIGPLRVPLLLTGDQSSHPNSLEKRRNLLERVQAIVMRLYLIVQGNKGENMLQLAHMALLQSERPRLPRLASKESEHRSHRALYKDFIFHYIVLNFRRSHCFQSPPLWFIIMTYLSK